MARAQDIVLKLRLQSDNGRAVRRAKRELKALNAELDQTAASATRAQSRLDLTSSALASMAIAQAVVGLKTFGKAAVEASLNLEQVVANVSTIKDIDVSAVSTELLQMAAEIGESAVSLGNGLYDIFSGVNATQEEGLKLLKVYSKGAKAAVTDTKTFGTAISGVLNAYKKDFSEAEKIADIFFQTVKNGVVTGDELARNLGAVVQPAKNLQISMGELGALIAAVTKEGGAASVNINNLANVLNKLPVKRTRKALEAFGVSLYDASKKARPIFEVLRDLKTQLASMDDKARSIKIGEIFEDTQAKIGLLTLLSQLDHGVETLQKITTESGTAEKAFQRMAGTGRAALDRLKNAALSLLGIISEWTVQSKLGIAVFDQLAKLLQAVPRYTKAIKLFTAALIAATVAARSAAIVSAATAAWAGLVKIFAALGVAIRSAWSALIGFRLTMLATATTAITVTGGLAALAFAIGGVIAFIYEYNTAQADSNKLLSENTDLLLANSKKNTVQLDQYQKQLFFLKQLEGTTLKLVLRKKQLRGIYTQLDKDFVSRIQKLDKEKKSYKGIRIELENLIKLERQRSRLNLTKLENKLLENSEAFTTARNNLLNAEARLRRAESTGTTGAVRTVFSKTFGAVVENQLTTPQLIQKYKDEVKTFKNSLLEIKIERNKLQSQIATDKFVLKGGFLDGNIISPTISPDGNNPGKTKKTKENAKIYSAIIAESDKITSKIQDRMTTQLPVKTFETIVRGAIADRIRLVDEELEQAGYLYEAQQKLLSNDYFRRLSREKQTLEEQLELNWEIFDLQNKLANQGLSSAQRYKKAWLEAVHEVRDANIKAIESQIRSLVKLSEQMNFQPEQVRAKVLGHLASQKSISGAIADDIIGMYDRMAKASDNFFDRHIGRVPILGAIVKTHARNTLTNWTRGVLDSFLPPSISKLLDPTKSNPIASPIVEKIEITNTHLQNIESALTGRAAPGLPAAASRILGLGGTAGGMRKSPGGLIGAAMSGFGWLTPGFNPNAGGGLGGWSGFGKPQGGWWDSIKSIFSKKGIGRLFGGGRGTLGGALGILGGAGAVTGLLGAMIGGGVGRTMSTVGGAAAAGAVLGGPLGAIAGGALGGLFSIFTRGRRRRRDERTRDAAMVKALRMLNRIKDLVNQKPPGIDLNTAATNAQNIEQQYFSAMGSLKDGKTRRIALKDGRERVTPLVQQILADIDRVRAELKAAEANRRDISSRFAGQFARGGFMSADFWQQHLQFKRRNGLLPGVWTGRDYLPSYLAEKEMVINPPQIARIIRAAGFDVFKGAGIPNYKPTTEVPKFNTGINLSGSNSISAPPRPNIEIGDIVINLNGERLRDADIESIAVGGVLKYQKSRGRMVS